MSNSILFRELGDVEIAELIRNIYDKTNAFDLVILYWTKNVTDRSYKIANSQIMVKLNKRLIRIWTAF